MKVQKCTKENVMKAEYRNAQRSKELIKSALISLIEKKQNVSDITITEIVNMANINRGTFYNHYNNIMEVLDELKAEVIGRMSEALMSCRGEEDMESFIAVLIEHFKKNEKSYKRIIKGIPREVVADMKLQFVKQIQAINKNVDPFMLNFAVNGLAGMCYDYLEGHVGFTLDQIGVKSAEILKKLVCIDFVQ